MRNLWKIAIALALALATEGTYAAASIVAIFNNLAYRSLEGLTNDRRSGQQARLSRLEHQLRDSLAKLGRLEIIDIATVAANARAGNLPSCDGCAKQTREAGPGYSTRFDYPPDWLVREELLALQGSV